MPRKSARSLIPGIAPRKKESESFDTKIEKALVATFKSLEARLVTEYDMEINRNEIVETAIKQFIQAANEQFPPKGSVKKSVSDSDNKQTA